MRVADYATIAEERDYWQAYAKQLEAELRPDNLPPEIRDALTKTHAALLSALIARAWCSRDGLLLAVYGSYEQVSDAKILDTWMCLLRKRVKPFGLEIETMQRLGYRLSAKSRAVVMRWANRRVA